MDTFSDVGDAAGCLSTQRDRQGKPLLRPLLKMITIDREKTLTVRRRVSFWFILSCKPRAGRRRTPLRLREP
jgi:hypothetical protein